MISSIIGDVLLRQVPDALAAGVKSGDYKVYGSIIRSVSSNRIVGHLQEAGGLSRLSGVLGAGPLAPFKLLADGVVIVQNEQMKASLYRIETGVAQLQQLGVANLALGAAGLGVSLAGFAVLGRKIDCVKHDVAELAGRIEAVGKQVKDLHHEVIAIDMDRLTAAAEAMDHGWTLRPAAAESQWQDVAREALKVSVAFERRARVLLAKGPAELETAEPMLEAHAMAICLRVTAWGAAGEEEAALSAAAQGSKATMDLTGHLSLVELTQEFVDRNGDKSGSAEWGSALIYAADQARPVVERLRQREAAAATRALPLAEVRQRGISMRDWMAAARDEKDVPLLVMPVVGS